MMRKTIATALVFVVLLSLCACGDGNQPAETINPACIEGHTWVDATCNTPKTCSVCNIKDGKALGHSWKDGTCTVCKAEDLNYDPLLDGVWLYIERQNWKLFDFQPDGTCDLMNVFGNPIADYDLKSCVNKAVESLKMQYGEDWETYARGRYHVVKIIDYYYVVEMTSKTETFQITDDLITIGNIPPVSYLIIINDKVLESGENDSRFSKVDFSYLSNLVNMYNNLQ